MGKVFLGNETAEELSLKELILGKVRSSWLSGVLLTSLSDRD